MRRRGGNNGPQRVDALKPRKALSEEDRSKGNTDHSRRRKQLSSQCSHGQHVRRAHRGAESERKKQQGGGDAKYGLASHEKGPETDDGAERNHQSHRRAEDRKNPDTEQSADT